MAEDIRDIITDAIKDAFPSEKIDNILELVKKHDATLYGNGKPGLVTIISDHDKFINSVRGTLEAAVRVLFIALVISLTVLAVQHGLLKP